MGKTSDKQKLENYRQEVAKKYNDRIHSLEADNKALRLENDNLKKEISEMRSKISSLNEWVERMQDYVNMSPEELNELIENEKLHAKASESILNLFGVMKSFRSTTSY